MKFILVPKAELGILNNAFIWSPQNINMKHGNIKNILIAPFFRQNKQTNIKWAAKYNWYNKNITSRRLADCLWCTVKFEIDCAIYQWFSFKGWLGAEGLLLTYSVQKTLWGRAANMGSKISRLVYQWPLILCTIWCMNWSSFQISFKFEPKLDQI